MHDVISAVRLNVVDDQAFILLHALRDFDKVAIFGQWVDINNVGWFVHDGLIEASAGALANDHSVILIVMVDEAVVVFSHYSFHLLTHLVIFPHVEVVLLVCGVAVAEGGEVGEL